MLEKVEVLNILKKYGYYSINRIPFVYQDENNLGVCFSWPNKHFGNLERVILLETKEQAEDEIYKYWWYMNNKDKYSITTNFDNFAEKFVRVTYYYKGNTLTTEVMKNFDGTTTFFTDPKDTLKKRQLFRTATILILVLKEKLRIQNDNYEQLLKLSEDLNSLKNEYKKKINIYKKGISEDFKSYEILKENQDESAKFLRSLHEEMDNLITLEDIRNFINTLYNYLVNLETSTSNVQNMYLLKRYPLEIDDLNKKIKVLDEAINTKKKLFQAKQDLSNILLSIDNTSPCKKMMDIKTFTEKEQLRIKEKYQNRETIDENVLGDYLVSFENLPINLPPLIENNYYEEFDKDDLLEQLKSTFNDLSKKEQSACFVASSFLRECLVILMKKQADTLENINEVISRLVLDNQIHLFNDAFITLDYYLNAKIRVKYFSIIKIKNFESFMMSLLEVIDILKNLKICLNKSFYGYYIDREKEIVNLYLKNIVKLNKKTSYIAKFMPNVPLYYSPVSIICQLDIVNNSELVERENDTIFFLKDRVGIKEKKEKIEVTKYELEKDIKDKITVVHDLKEKNRCCYYEDLIYNKDDGGLYE